MSRLSKRLDRATERIKPSISWEVWYQDGNDPRSYRNKAGLVLIREQLERRTDRSIAIIYVTYEEIPRNTRLAMPDNSRDRQRRKDRL